MFADDGVWWASNDNVVSIDSATGISTVTGSGNTLVYYNTSVSLPTYIEAKVSSVSQVSIVDADDMVITNSPGPEVNGSYLVRVQFGSERTVPLPGCDIPVFPDSTPTVRFPFTCELSLENSQGIKAEQVFSIEPGYNSGKSVCAFFPKILSTADAKLLITSETELMLKVTLQDPNKGTEFSSAPVHLHFVPAFMLERHDVMLKDNTDSIKIYASGEMLKSLQVSFHICPFNKIIVNHCEAVVS